MTAQTPAALAEPAHRDRERAAVERPRPDRNLAKRPLGSSMTPLDARPAPTASRDDRTESAATEDLLLRAAINVTGASVYDVWIEYAGLGGDQSVEALACYASGQGQLPPVERVILAHALHERLVHSGVPPLSPDDS